jgi:hypothetical protein
MKTLTLGHVSFSLALALDPRLKARREPHCMGEEAKLSSILTSAGQTVVDAPELPPGRRTIAMDYGGS